MAIAAQERGAAVTIKAKEETRRMIDDEALRGKLIKRPAGLMDTMGDAVEEFGLAEFLAGMANRSFWKVNYTL